MARDSELSCITVLDTVTTQQSPKHDTVGSRSTTQSFPNSHHEVQDTPPRHGHCYATPTSHSNPHQDTPPGSHTDMSPHKPMGNGVNCSGSILLEQQKIEVLTPLYMYMYFYSGIMYMYIYVMYMHA